MMPYLRAFLYAAITAVVVGLSLAFGDYPLPDSVYKMAAICFVQTFIGYCFGYYTEKPTPLTDWKVRHGKGRVVINTDGLQAQTPANRNDVYRVVAYDAIAQLQQYGCINNVTYDELNDAKRRLTCEEETQGHHEIIMKIEIQRFGA